MTRLPDSVRGLSEQYGGVVWNDLLYCARHHRNGVPARWPCLECIKVGLVRIPVVDVPLPERDQA